MTDCKQFQKQFCAAPAAMDLFLSKHAEQCAECADFARQILLLQRRLLSAVEMHVPASLQDKLQRIPVRERNRSLREFSLGAFALAASVILGTALFNSGLLPLPLDPGLEQVVYEHIIHEPQALTPVFPVKHAILQTTLKDFGVEFSDPEFGEVLHGTLCPIGDTHGLHLVVQGQRGPVTLLFMPTKSVETRIPFHEGRFEGYIVPVEVGLVAIVGEQGERLDRFDRAIKQSMRWL
ncbi:MAG: DUF3379 domain-containing protein [Methylococcaceae bacterium]|nr:DUF3379 domain-containing protein [Methylococcaceae bacterium]